jgi:hypothetical protein
MTAWTSDELTTIGAAALQAYSQHLRPGAR